MIITKGKRQFKVEVRQSPTILEYALYQESLIESSTAGATPASIGIYDGASAFLYRYFTINDEILTFPQLEELGWEPSQFNQLLGFFNSPPESEPDWEMLTVDGVTLAKNPIPVRQYYEVVAARSRFHLMVDWLCRFFTADGQPVASDGIYPFDVVKAVTHRAGKC